MSVTLQGILQEFREIASSKRNLGNRFELLILAYLRQDPVYYQRFSNGHLEKFRSGQP